MAPGLLSAELMYRSSSLEPVEQLVITTQVADGLLEVQLLDATVVNVSTGEGGDAARFFLDVREIALSVGGISTRLDRGWNPPSDPEGCSIEHERQLDLSLASGARPGSGDVPARYTLALHRIDPELPLVDYNPNVLWAAGARSVRLERDVVRSSTCFLPASLYGLSQLSLARRAPPLPNAPEVVEEVTLGAVVVRRWELVIDAEGTRESAELLPYTASVLRVELDPSGLEVGTHAFDWDASENHH